MVSFFLPADSSELQCSLEGIQNWQEMTMFFGENSKQTRRQKNFCWKCLWFPLPGFSAPCDLPFKELSVWRAGSAGSPAPRPTPSLVVPLTQAAGSPLAQGGDEEHTGEVWSPWPTWLGDWGMSLAYKYLYTRRYRCAQQNSDLWSFLCSGLPALGNAEHLKSTLVLCTSIKYFNNKFILWRIGIWENEALGFFFHGTAKA